LKINLAINHYWHELFNLANIQR